MIAHTYEQTNGRATRDKRALLLSEDSVFHGLVAAVCERMELTVVQKQWRDAWLPACGPHPQVLLLGFTLRQESSLHFHAVCPNVPIEIITGEAPADIVDVVGLAGGTAIATKPCSVEDLSRLHGITTQE